MAVPLGRFFIRTMAISVVISCCGHTMASDQMEKRKRDLATAAKVTKDTEMIMAPHANWENYLTPAPTSIAVLGELIFISAQKDFSINKNPPKGGYKYIRYPNSFRASLMQVCNSGWQAFNEAHNSMDQIRLHTANMPMHVKNAVEIILMDDTQLMEIMLPDVLETVENIAKSCLSLAQSTRDHFQAVVNLTHELIEVSTDAQQAYNQDLQKVNEIIKNYKIRQEEKDKASKRAEQDLKDFKEKWEAAEQTFDESMKDMPSGWDLIGMNVAEGLAEGLNSLVKGATKIVTLNQGGESGKEDGNKKSASTQAVENARLKITESKEALKSARDMYNEGVKRLEKERNDMTDVLITLASANVQEIDFKTTLEFLALGLEALGKVKEQWEKMTQFFQVVLNIIKASMNTSTDTFVKQVGVAKKVHEAGVTNSPTFVKENVYNQALQVSTLANLVKMLSTTYVTVSGQHIMGRISSLGRLMALQVGSADFERERLNLQNGCKSAQEAIVELVKKNQLEFQTKTEERLKEIFELERLLLPAKSEL